MNKNSSNPWTEDELLRAIYLGFLEREPDESGLEHWKGQLQKGENLTNIIKAFVESPEYKNKKNIKISIDNIIKKVTEYANLSLKEEKITIVDIGAQQLEQEGHIYQPLLDSNLQCKIIGFEPLEGKSWQNLKTNKNHDVKLYPNFIGDGQRHNFHINQPDSTSSLLPFNQSITKDLIHLDSLQTISKQTIETVSLDQAIEDVREIDFMKLDIQGFEHPTLINATNTLSKTLVVHCEVAFIEIYKNQSLFAEVDQLLRKAGFRFIDFQSLCKYSFTKSFTPNSLDQLGWGDAVYFKNLEQLKQPMDLLKQSIIALLIYRKNSFAQFLAREYDLQTGNSFNLLFQS